MEEGVITKGGKNNEKPHHRKIRGKRAQRYEQWIEVPEKVGEG